MAFCRERCRERETDRQTESEDREVNLAAGHRSKLKLSGDFKVSEPYRVSLEEMCKGKIEASRFYGAI